MGLVLMEIFMEDLVCERTRALKFEAAVGATHANSDKKTPFHIWFQPQKRLDKWAAEYWIITGFDNLSMIFDAR